jgi:RNA polymerase sigma factor (sigma-70 family)
MMSEPSGGIASLVRSAADGDPVAWNSLVEQFSPHLWSVVRGYRLTDEEAADVFQQTWLRLIEYLGHIEDPARLGAWLATTARRETLKVIRGRSVPIDPDDLPDIVDHDRSPEVDHDRSPEDALLASERDQALRHAIGQLPVRCQKLLALLTSEPPMSYTEIAAAVGAPVGSIGPTRRRCLQRLRELLGRYPDDEDVDLAPAIRSGVGKSGVVPDKALGRAQKTFVERHQGDDGSGTTGAADQVAP